MRLLWLLAFAAVGCVTPDIEIRNPLTAQAVDPNRILKQHGYIEAQLGIPSGSMADEAQLLSVDPGRICVGVTLHELSPIDLNQVTINLSAPKVDPVETGEMWSEPPSQTTYNGLIPQRRQVGARRICLAYGYGGYCVRWGFTPIYARYWVRGPVPVFETRGRMCFQNRSITTAVSEWLSLELRLPKNEAGWGGVKRVRFVWGFLRPKG